MQNVSSRYLPQGARRLGPVEGSACLEWCSQGGKIIGYCTLCGQTPKNLRGRDGAILRHTHEAPCEVCGVSRSRKSTTRPNTTDVGWMPCVNPHCSVVPGIVLDCSEAVAAMVISPVGPVERGTSTYLDVVHVIGLGGMWCDRTGGGGHADSARAQQLRAMVGARASVLCLTNNHGVPARSVTTLQADVRHNGSWYRWSSRRGVDPDTITGRGVTIFILDYFWLECGYYTSVQPLQLNGYGGRWFSDTLPLFFENGGCIALLPNDRWGELEKMVQQRVSGSGADEIGVEYLDVSTAERVHSLYIATASITDARTGFLRGVDDQNERNNDSAVRQYLNPSKPFLLVFNTILLPTVTAALSELESLLNT